MFIFIFLLCVMVVVSGVGVYVDPHDMDVNNLHKIKPQSLPEKVFEQKEKLQCISDLFFRRTLRLLLENAVKENNDDDDYYSGYININLKRDDYEYLQVFARSNTSDFQHVQSIIETAVQKPIIQQYSDMVLTLQEQIKFVLFNPTTILIFITIILFGICYKFYYDKWALIKFILITLYAIDYVLRYLQLIQLAEIEQMVTMKKHGHIPPECDPNKMNWREFFEQKIRGLFSEDSCREYYKASYQNLNYLVTPLNVFANQLNIVIVEPLTHLGNGIGKFTSSLLGSLPLGYSLLLAPIVLLLVFIFLILIISFITNKALEFNSLLFQLRLGVAQPKIERHPSSTSSISSASMRYIPKKSIKLKSPKAISYKVKSIKNH